MFHHMRWHLKHFGLGIKNPQAMIARSSLKVTETLAHYTEEEQEFTGTIMDPKLDGPVTEKTMCNVFGHVVLESPVPRPECIDQLIEVFNEKLEFDHPLRQQGKAKSLYFELDNGDSEDKQVVSPEEIHQLLGLRPPVIIHGDQFTEHNIDSNPANMMLTVLPVPSIASRGGKEALTHDLTLKLNDIVDINQRIKILKEKGDVPAIIIEDMSYLLRYHVWTYLDNAIPGIPSAINPNDGTPLMGVAQFLGAPAAIQDKDGNVSDASGSSLQRIARGINMGEPVLCISTGRHARNLAFELAKQVVFERLWVKTERNTEVHFLNGYGEVERITIGIIDSFTWEPWDGDKTFDRNTVVEPRFDAPKVDDMNSELLQNTVERIKEIDVDFKLTVAENQALTYLYNLKENERTERPNLIVVCDLKMNPIVLRPLLRKLRHQEKTAGNFCLVLTQLVDDEVVKYQYSPTPDDYRNVIIALANLMERPEFEDKKEMVAQFQATDLKQISTYVKGLRRTEIIQILGEIIVSEGQLDAKFVRDYIRDYLDAQGRSYDHLEADTEKDDTTGFHSNPDKIVEEQATGGHLSRQSKGDEELSYASLKGLEPLVTWVKGKGKLFTPAAREYGFTRFPRGLLLTGVPGCGKSMTAKVIAKEWGMNFHRISPEDIRGKFHGEDEHNLREILNQLVKNAPSLCFVDEAEKLFRSVDKGGNSSTAAIDSTEGMLLQFMEDNREPVFFIFTSNDLQKMSPAIIDRFDGRFFVDLPDEVARQEIIELVLNESKKGELDIDIVSLAKMCEGFTGRDIRGAIEEAMMVAFIDEQRELCQDDLKKSFAGTKPTSVVHQESIRAMRELVSEGKIRSANSLRPSVKKNHDVSFG